MSLINSLLPIQLAAGQYSDHTTLFKFGSNSAVGTGEETIWDQGGLYNYLTTAATLKVSSSASGDNNTNVVITGLNEDYEEVTETIALAGQTPVDTTETYIRVYRAHVADGDTINGDIYVGSGTVTSGVPANKYAKIIAGQNQTLMAVYTVPAGHKLYLTSMMVGSGTETANRYIDMRLAKRESDSNAWRTQVKQTIADSTVNIPFGAALVFNAKTDIEVRASASSGTQDVAAHFIGVLVKD